MSLLVLESDGIARVVSVLPLEAENLFAAWIGFVVNTELCHAADLVVELNFHKFVDDFHIGRVGRR